MPNKKWPHTDNHFNFLNRMEKVLEKADHPLTRSKLSEEIRAGEKGLDISGHTVNRWLSQYRTEIESQGFETEERDDGSPGHLAVYWKVEK